MAYFDSPKNRAMWEKEMARLRKERELRKKSEYAIPDERQENMEQAMEDTKKRELISCRDLQQEQDRGGIVCG